MKALILGLLFSCLVPQAFGCEQDEILFPKNSVCAKINWITGPATNQFNSASIHITETDLKLNVVPWMVMDAGHEHGSRPVTITSVSPNDYLVEKLYFMAMAGEWFLKLQLVDAQKNIIEEVKSKVEL